MDRHMDTHIDTHIHFMGSNHFLNLDLGNYPYRRYIFPYTEYSCRLDML
jgi:hypothetical protein